jgi:hypothetical protein
MLGIGDDDRPIQDHDLIVCPCMPRIEGYREPRPQEDCDGRDRGIMRLDIGIEDHLHLDPPRWWARTGAPARRVEWRRDACTRIVCWALLMPLRIACVAPPLRLK